MPMRMNPVLDQLGTYPIATIKKRASDLAASGVRVIDFSIGDPVEPTPEFITATLADAIPAVSQYPTVSGLESFRAAVAGFVLRRYGVSVDPDTQIIPTSGSKEAIFSTPLAFVDRAAGDIVVIPSPGYPVYERGSLFAGAQLHRVVLKDDFVMRASDIPPDIWLKTRLVWTCSPHNPSGAVTSHDDLAELYRTCKENGALLLSDECYTDTYEDAFYPEGPTSVLQVADDTQKGVLVYLSLSKRSGMTGYRSGAIVGDADAIAILKNLRTSTGSASPSFVQSAAAAAWADDEHATQRRELFTQKRQILAEAFRDTEAEIVASKAGLYLWVHVGDDIAVADRLLAAGIVVSPGRFFGEGGEGYIRLALVPTLEECQDAVDELRAALTEVGET